MKMKKKINTQQQQQINMQRKVTIKKYSDPYNFSIYQDGNKIFKILISPNSTVNELIFQVKNRLGPNVKNFIGLMSIDNNQIIDYTLKIDNFSLSNYSNNMSFNIQRRYQVQNEKQPSLNDFDFLKLLGSGVSASVYLVRHKSNGILYALKQISKNYFRDFKRVEQVLRQRKIMTQMIKQINFTTRLIASFQSQKYLNLLLQFYPGGQMFVHLQRRRLSQQQAKLYVAELILTFQKLHQRKIIYRDLKPQNIMIDFDGHARLGDYGLCKINLEYYDLTYSYCGSQQYMAPQVRTQNGYNYSVDFYTLGSFAYQLVNGVPPYYNNQPLFFHQSSSDQFIQIVQKLIDSNIHKRLKSFSQIKKMKWFKNISWKKIIQKKYQMPFRIDVNQNYIGQQFKNQIIDPEVQQDKKFDKLLECFFYLSFDEGGISQFYKNNKKQKNQFFNFNKNKIKNLQKSNSKSRKSSKSYRNSQKSSKSQTRISSRQKKTLKKKLCPSTNIYTNQKILIKNKSRHIFSGCSSSKNLRKNNLISSIDSQKQIIKKETKLKKSAHKKIQINKINNFTKDPHLITNTSKKLIELRNIFSPIKFKQSKN